MAASAQIIHLFSTNFCTTMKVDSLKTMSDSGFTDFQVWSINKKMLVSCC